MTDDRSTASQPTPATRTAAAQPTAGSRHLSAPTSPTYDYRACITERVWVETPVDTDGDGLADLIAVYVRRPRETADGLVVPAIYVADPYMMGCDDDGYTPHDTDVELTVGGDGTDADADNTADTAPHDSAVSADSAPQAAADQAAFRPTKSRPTTGIGPADHCDFPELECISDYYAFYNSCGYATVFCAGLGTRGSQGFNDCGSPEEAAAFAAVVDWLNGRARAFTNPTDNVEVKADWASGKVAMTGKSYLGTMCVAVAATGVRGLATILPVAGISDWYDYYRCNGLARPALGWQGDDIDLLNEYCFSRVRDGIDDATKAAYDRHLADIRERMDRDGGDRNPWWQERDYLSQLERLPERPCPAFIVQGLDDMNVKPSQATRLAATLRSRGTRTTLVLHRGAHCYTHDLEGNPVNEFAHRWLDHYLIDDNTDIADIPATLVQDDVDQRRWTPYDGGFPEHGELPEFRPAGGGETNPADDRNGGQNDDRNDDPSATPATVTIVDDIDATAFDRTHPESSLDAWRDELVLSDPAPRHELRFDTASFTADTRLGRERPVVEFEASFDSPAAILSVMLVDVGTHERLTCEQETVGSMRCGLNGPEIELKRFVTEREPSPYRVLTRGWTNAQNVDGSWTKRRLEPGRRYHYAIDMEPFERMIPAGDRLRLIVFGVDPEATVKPSGTRRIAVDPASVRVR